MTTAERTAWDALQAERDSLFAENATLKEASDSLKKQIEALTATNAAQTEVVLKQAAENTALADQVKSLTTEYTALKDKPLVNEELIVPELLPDETDPEPKQSPYLGQSDPDWMAWRDRRLAAALKKASA